MKKIFLITLMSLIIVLMAGIVYGACTWGNPTSSGTLRGSESINASCGADDDAVNCTVTVTSATSGTSSMTLNLSNTSDTQINSTWGSTAAKDASDYQFSAVCYNNSNQSYTAVAATSVVIDNTKPVTTLSSPADLSKDTDGSITFTYVCSNATSSTLYVEGTAYTMTESSDSCSYTGIWKTNGFFTHYITASDGLNTTTSSSSKVEIRRPGGIIYDEKGEIMAGTAGATVKSGNAVANIVNGLFDFIFGIFDTIFSIFK